MKIIPLGTNGFFSSFGRQTACYAIPLGKTLIILDAGTGLFRLGEKESGKLLAGVSNIHLYLSHYHLDHTFGFYAAFKLLEGKKVTVFAETERQVFWEFVSLKHFPVDYQKVHRNFSWQELKIGENKISDYKVFVRKQYHRGEGSLALRFKFKDKTLAYVTDSEPGLASIEFVKGVDLLLHEWEAVPKSWQRKKLEEQIHDGHVTIVGAAQIAKRAEVGRLVLIHHYPFADKRELSQQLKVAKSIFPRAILGEDNQSIEI